MFLAIAIEYFQRKHLSFYGAKNENWKKYIGIFLYSKSMADFEPFHYIENI